MITIDLQNRQAIYEQIVERFETLIVNGILEPDSQMPSVRSLAVELSINPNTIQKAYGVLEQEGYIYPVKGRGNFVSGNEDLKVRKQESLYVSLGELVEKGKELDITCEMFVAKTRELYAEDRPGRGSKRWQRSSTADLTEQEPEESGEKPTDGAAGRQEQAGKTGKGEVL